MQDQRDRMITEQARTIDDLGWRLALAQRFSGLMLKAYDALQAYGIDYRKLRTYPLWEHLLPVGATFDKPEARNKITEWVVRCGHDIDAAVRRKTNLKLAFEQGADPENGI